MRPATKKIIWLLLIGGEALEEPKFVVARVGNAPTEAGL
jgi:hypothetical protein